MLQTRLSLLRTMQGPFGTVRAGWIRLSSRSPLARLGQASLVAALLSVVTRSISFVKEIFVASAFGVSDALDVYLMVFVLIGFPLAVLINAVQTVMISTLAAVQGDSDRTGTIYTTTALATLLALAALLPLWLFALQVLLPWLASGFSQPKLDQLESALFWMIPYYFLNALNLLGYGVLQARQRFVMNGLLPALTPLVTIPIVAVWGGTQAWQLLVVALTIGAVLENIALNAMLARAGLLRRFDFGNADCARILLGSKALLPGTLMLSLGPIAEQAIAAAQGSGAVSVLGYAYRLPAALNNVVITAIGITVLPYFSALLAEGKTRYALHSLVKSARWLLFLGLGCAGALVLLSETLVTLIYERGAFDAAATALVYPIQQIYFLQFPFALLAILGFRMLAALQRNSVASLLAGLGVMVQVAVAYTLSTQIGVAGVAWGAVTASIFLSLVTYLISRHILKRGTI